MILEFGSAQITFDVDADGWCKVRLVRDGQETFLGAESWRIIRERLLKCFSTPCLAQDHEWVLSLSEAHHTLYRRESNGELELCWQDPKANFLPGIMLSLKAQSEAVSKLR